MAHDIQDVLARFAAAVVEVLALKALRHADPGEPHVVSELFVRLRERFPGWDVGNEYDRREQARKRLSHPNPKTGDALEADIRPDLIVHRAGVRDNLLVIEVKRHVNTNIGRDVWKLTGMTAAQGDYGYAVGVHLILNVPAGTVVSCDVYLNGVVDAAYTAWLRERLPG